MEQEPIKKETSSKGSYLTGILGAIVGGAIATIPWILVYVYGEMMFSILAALIAAGELYGYKIAKGKITKKLPIILMVIALIIVTVTTLVIIPTLLIAKEGIAVNLTNISRLYENGEFATAMMKDFIISVIFTILGASIVTANIKKQLENNEGQDVKLNLNNKEEKNEIKKATIELMKPIFIKYEATEQGKAMLKDEVIAEIDDKRKAKYSFNYLKQMGIIKKYKGKYYYCEEAESNIKIHYAYWKGAIAIAIAAVSIACILFSFGLISQSKKKVYNNDVSFSIDNTWNEYKVNQSTEDDETTVEKTWRYYKYMNANEVLAGNEEHSYPETITVSYGDNNFGKEIELNDLRDLFEGYFYEYMGFDNYQIEVLTTDNGYETLEIMLGYEDAMVFDYYLINGNKMAFISASTYSNDENLYDSLEEYTKEVVNSFKWNE